MNLLRLFELWKTVLWKPTIQTFMDEVSKFSGSMSLSELDGRKMTF